MAEFLQGLSGHGIFSRGLPTREDLKTDKYAECLLQVLGTPGRSVVVTEELDKGDPLRQCLEKGWLFSERGVDQKRSGTDSRLHCMNDMQNGFCLSKKLPSKPPLSRHSLSESSNSSARKTLRQGRISRVALVSLSPYLRRNSSRNFIAHAGNIREVW